jgi:hypothetical protein
MTSVNHWTSQHSFRLYTINLHENGPLSQNLAHLWGNRSKKGLWVRCVALPHTAALPHTTALPHTAALPDRRTLPYALPYTTKRRAHCVHTVTTMPHYRTSTHWAHTSLRALPYTTKRTATHCRAHCRTLPHCRTAVQSIYIKTYYKLTSIHIKTHKFI